MKLEILTDLRELNQEKNQETGSCRIWLRIGNLNFPEDNWYDLLFILLPEWSLKITEVIQKRLKQGVIRFVDGDYAARFVLIKGDKYRVSFGRWDMFDDIFDVTIEASYEIDIQDFAKELHRVNERVLNRAQKMSLTSEYLHAVENFSKKLMLALSSPPANDP